jgi:hypothetical protein
MRRSRRESFAIKDLAALNVTLSHELASESLRLRFVVEYARARWGRGGAARRGRFVEKVVRRSLHIGSRRKFHGVDWRRSEE